MPVSGFRLQTFGFCAAFVIGAAIATGQEDDSLLFSRPAPAAPAPPANADQELNALQLRGISTLGGASMFNFVDSRNNRSFWVPLHGTVDGYSVLSWNAESDTVVVGFDGRTRPIGLRQAQIASMPSPGATPASAAQPALTRPAGMPAKVIRTADGGEIVNPKTPQEIAQAETEARMMVSDLLEISMQERARQKALREAARRKQEEQQNAAPPAAER